MTTDIAITFDIEFDINRTFKDPDSYQPRGREGLICPVGGVDVGLGRILEILGRYGLRATFFIETLHTSWFGVSEMAEVVAQIAAEGHEMQLHLHPVWLQFENPHWKQAVRTQKVLTQTHDSLLAVDAERAREIVETGLDVFQQWGLPRPTAVRTGNLIIGQPLYKVFAECGLAVSSSVGLGVFRPHEADLQLYSAAREVDGVMELPVTSFHGADHRLRRAVRTMTVIGTGQRELGTLLLRARRVGLPFLVLLSHVSEFCSTSPEGNAVPNNRTARKFEALCRRIAETPDLEAVTIADLAAAQYKQLHVDDVPLAVPRLVSAARFFV